MSDPIFVYFGTTDYYGMILRNVGLLRRQYPDADVVIYACGPTPMQMPVGALGPTVQIIDWRDQLETTLHISRAYCGERIHQMAIDLNSRHRGLMKRVRKFFLKRFPNSPVSKAMHERVVAVENMILNKVLVLKDFSTRAGDRPFIFLDADAFVAGRLDELADGDPDLTVTLVPSHLQDEQIGHCILLNVGVMYFGPRASKRDAFFEAWAEATLDMYEVWREQTALSRLLVRHAPEIMSFWNRETIRFGDHDVNVLVVPCEPFNLCHLIEDYKWRWADAPEARVYHLANMAQNMDMFEDAMTALAPRFQHQGSNQK